MEVQQENYTISTDPSRLLATRDAHGLYRQFGFTELTKPETMMEKFDDSAIRR
jgi:hypothetical protein